MTCRPAAAGAIVALVALLAPAPAFAHAIAVRYDLPLPLGHYVTGAGLTVALSFVVAALFLHAAPARLTQTRIPLPEAPLRVVLAVLRVTSVASFVLLLAIGLLGPQGDWDSNLLVVTVWVVWWVGLAFVSALIGNFWALINPFVIVARWLRAWRGGARPPSPERARLALRLGAWPAVVLLLGFAWAELVWPANAVPMRLACAIGLYAAITWTGMAIFGIETWRRQGEVFSLLLGLFARFAPLSAEREGERTRLIVRPWGAGLAGGQAPSASMTAFVLVVLAHVGFDGIAETPWWYDVGNASMGIAYRGGLVHAIGYGPTGAVIMTAGLLATPLVFAGVYLATAGVIARIEGARVGEVARAYILTLVPIAIGYHLAHYFSYLLIQGQMLIPLASDPFGRGWDLFGGAGRPLDIDIVSARAIWVTAVAGVVVGHVAAVMLAHLEALRRNSDRRRALVGQLPMTGLMIGYTMLSLWILSQPIVAH